MEQNSLTGALNKEGFFFQKYCAEKIRASGWTVEIEEYPISENESFDIKATLALFETTLNTAVVECKRSDPKRKQWAFFRKESSSANMSEFAVQTHHLSSEIGGFLRKGRVWQGVLEILNEEELGFPCCHTVGLEMYKDEKNARDWKANPQTVYGACLTVAKGVNYLFESEAHRLHNNLRIDINRLRSQLKIPCFFGGDLIPVVITSAPILSVSFDPNDMDIETFQLPQEKTHYQEKEWLVYEFPLPRELWYESKNFFRIVGENRYAKMHIFMVNGRHIKRFFECLRRAIENPGKKSGRALVVEYSEVYDTKKQTR